MSEIVHPQACSFLSGQPSLGQSRKAPFCALSPSAAAKGILRPHWSDLTTYSEFLPWIEQIEQDALKKELVTLMTITYKHTSLPEGCHSAPESKRDQRGTGDC